MEDSTGPGEAQENLYRWANWNFQQLFPRNVSKLVLTQARADGKRLRRGTRRPSPLGAPAFLRKMDRLKSDAELRDFVFWSGSVVDLMRVYILLSGFVDRVQEMDPKSDAYQAMHNRMALNPSVLYACRIEIDLLIQEALLD